MNRYIVVFAVAALLTFDGCSVHSLTDRLRKRADSISAQEDTAGTGGLRFVNVCFPTQQTIEETQTDSCFRVSRSVVWYYNHPYPPRYAVFHYRRFGSCPPFTYYVPDCDCCRHSGVSPDSQKTDEERIHASPGAAAESDPKRTY
jgi:hypothetical protein